MRLEIGLCWFGFRLQWVKLRHGDFRTLAAHGYFEAVSPQSLLIIMGAILAAAICMMNAARRRSSKRDGHVESSYGQITLEPIADSPANDAAGMQINHHRQI